MSDRDTATQVASYLRRQAVLRFEQHGAYDPRGAAWWDAGCAIDPEDGDVLGVGAAKVAGRCPDHCLTYCEPCGWVR